MDMSIPTTTQRYAKCIETSKRIRFDIDRDVIRGRKLDFGRLREAQRDQALNEVKASMILDKIAETENVSVGDEDLERELLMLSLQSREPLDTLRERLSKDGGLNRIR